jgi:metal-responsive CopG/Arc/MetJ family transcriptional regulator
MEGKKPEEQARTEGRSIVRSSITFPRDLYTALEVIARQKKVSLAWVVRDAAEQYISDKMPLFQGQP